MSNKVERDIFLSLPEPKFLRKQNIFTNSNATEVPFALKTKPLTPNHRRL